VLEDPDILDLVGGGGFTPDDLFAAPELPDPEHAFATARGVPSTWVVLRSDEELRATFNWSDEAVDGIAAHGVQVDRIGRPRA
jgi:hypothetical protein